MLNRALGTPFGIQDPSHSRLEGLHELAVAVLQPPDLRLRLEVPT